MKFFKAQANGNDYLVSAVKRDYLQRDDLGSIASRLCDRHYGIGSDGIVFVSEALGWDRPAWECRIFNPDGGEAEVSGNGLRCVAACLGFMEIHMEGELLLQTRSGEKRFRLLERTANRFLFQADMGKPLFQSDLIPMHLLKPTPLVCNYPLEVEGRLFTVTVLSMGNPHCVIFSDAAKVSEWEYWSARISQHRLFPQQTNVEWVLCESSDSIRVSFWERGVGLTLSSGSGSCAAAVASILAGKTKERVTVHSHSGTLAVEWSNRQKVFLTGQAEVIFEGNCWMPLNEK